MMKKFLVLGCLLVMSAQAMAAEDISPFLGRWALTIPGGGAGWLGVEDKGDYIDATILWGGGSVVDVAGIYLMDGRLHILRDQKVARKGANGKVFKTHNQVEHIIAQVNGDAMTLERILPWKNGKGAQKEAFTGKKIPALPPTPDLSKVKFGEPKTLLKKNSLDGWELINPKAKNGWSVKKGVLYNELTDHKGGWGNLRTTDEYEDFNLTLEVAFEKKGNSGVYLRGIYEVQVFDSYGMDLDSHNMGAVYSRITPSTNAEKPAGKWSSLDITLVDRHVTVILNGTKIIDNQPLLGCTGGAMTSDEFHPGPIYLQGDHGKVKYRNMTIKPVLK